MEDNEILVDEKFFLVLKKFLRDSTRLRLVNVLSKLVR